MWIPPPLFGGSKQQQIASKLLESSALLRRVRRHQHTWGRSLQAAASTTAWQNDWVSLMKKQIVNQQGRCVRGTGGNEKCHRCDFKRGWNRTNKAQHRCASSGPKVQHNTRDPAIDLFRLYPLLNLVP